MIILLHPSGQRMAWPGRLLLADRAIPCGEVWGNNALSVLESAVG